MTWLGNFLAQVLWWLWFTGPAYMLTVILMLAQINNWNKTCTRWWASWNSSSSPLLQ